MRNEDQYSVILDASFLIRLLSSSDPLHENAVAYYKHFLNHDIPMYVSTVTIAEYCVDGDVSELPLKNLRVVTFNFPHAPVAGTFANILFRARKKQEIDVNQRLIIPNDVKIYAQANCTVGIRYFVTSDTKASKLIEKISEEMPLQFSHLDIHLPLISFLGELF